MKKIISFCLAFAFSIFAFGQIEWAPHGAKWFYTFYSFDNWTGSYLTIETVEVKGDTIIENQPCKILQRSGDHWPALIFDFMFEENGKVYAYNGNTGAFGLLYDFTKLENEYWKVVMDTNSAQFVNNDTFRVHVDSIRFTEQSGQNIKTFHVHYEVENENIKSDLIFDGIGSAQKMWMIEPSDLAVIDFYYQNLRCYDSPATGLLKFIDEPCDSIPVATGEIEKLPFQLYLQPNPASGDCTVSFQLPTTTPAEILLSDSYGRILQRHPLPPGSESLTLSGLERGLYFISLRVDGKVVRTEKFIKQ